MDPLSALSVAAGVVQFVDFAFRLSGLWSDANTLDTIARDATELSDALASSPALSSSSTTLQALVGENYLNMQSVQIYSLKENALRLGMEDQNRVEKLRDEIAKRLERLSEETSKMQKDMQQLMEKLESNTLGPMDFHPSRLGLSRDLINYFSAIIEHLAEEQSLLASNQEFLESLYFSKIKARQRKIESAHSKTFGWIFRPSVPDGSKQISFYQWLSEGNGTFWIQGKAGSGKSTLLKFICGHRTTVELLRILRKCPELIPRVSKGNQKTPFRRRGPYSQTDDDELWSQEELMDAYRSLHMIDSIPSIYLPHMARTLWMATSVSQPQFLMVYSLLDDAADAMAMFEEEHPPEVMYDHEVRTRTQQMRRRLDGRCKGLLEVVLDEPDAGLYFEYKVDFLHRTVRDFLLGSPKIRQILEEQRFAELSGVDGYTGNAWLLPCLSILQAFKRAPFRTGPRAAAIDAELAATLLETLAMFAQEAEANMSDRSALIRVLYDAEKTYDLRRWQFSWLLDTNLFLGLACQADLFSYIQRRISPGWFSQPSDSVRCGSNSVAPTSGRCILESLSSWRTFLTEISSTLRASRDEQVRETLRLLLKCDVNLDAEITKGDGHLISAGKLELMLELAEPKEEPPKVQLEEVKLETVKKSGIYSWLFSWWNR
ncbi:hypothetical protein GGR55DRAFT_691877 [Xylaria sp. FL0064]|nr:hypothetical protein GGR55DRAFT_691877 [Xylaria sp. FL0064]